MKKNTSDSVIPNERIENCIYIIRKQKVMTDTTLADLYGVTTGHLNEAVKRNLKRFPIDFMFQLTAEETRVLISQIAIPNDRGGRLITPRFLPYAFTEQGVAMLSSVLNTDRAISVNIEIMRAFVKLRRLLETNADMAQHLNDLEKKYDSKFKIVFDAIRALMKPDTVPAKGPMGFGS